MCLPHLLVIPLTKMHPNTKCKCGLNQCKMTGLYHWWLQGMVHPKMTNQSSFYSPFLWLFLLCNIKVFWRMFLSIVIPLTYCLDSKTPRHICKNIFFRVPQNTPTRWCDQNSISQKLGYIPWKVQITIKKKSVRQNCLIAAICVDLSQSIVIMTEKMSPYGLKAAQDNSLNE